jgi:hypothetical protein
MRSRPSRQPTRDIAAEPAGYPDQSRPAGFLFRYHTAVRCTVSVAYVA